MHSTVVVMADVNIYYRLVKAMYSINHVHLNIRGQMHHRPLLFGIWHAYAHAVKRTFDRFRSFWCYIEYPDVRLRLGDRRVQFPEATKSRARRRGLVLVGQQRCYSAQDGDLACAT